MTINININEIKQKKLFIATPMYGGQCFGTFTKSLSDLKMIAGKYDLPIRDYFLFNESLIQRARNYCVDEFLRSESDFLLFIDADIGFNPKDVLALLHIANGTTHRIVTGPYPKKAIAWEKIKKAYDAGVGSENPYDLERFSADFVFNPAKGVTQFKLNEPLKIREGGTGFMMIHRSVFDEMREKFGDQMEYKPDHSRTEHFDGSRMIHAYFDCVIEPESKRYLSEDYYFSRNAEKLGIDTWLCPWMRLIHTGMHVFSGDLGSMVQLNMSATSDASSNRKVYKEQKTQQSKTYKKKKK